MLFLYGVIESCTIRTHYKLLRNLFSVRAVCISNFAGTYAHAWVQNPIIHPSHREVLFLYGVIESFHDSNPLQVARQLVIFARSRYKRICTARNAQMGVQNPTGDARCARVILLRSDIASQ